MKKKAVTLVARNEDGLILAVSRKDNPNDFGLPGGKVEDGETWEEALRREVLEETGCRVVKIKKVFEREDDEYLVYCYTTDWIIREMKSYEPGVIAWVTMDELMRGSFGEWNQALFKHLKWI